MFDLSQLIRDILLQGLVSGWNVDQPNSKEKGIQGFKYVFNTDEKISPSSILGSQYLRVEGNFQTDAPELQNNSPTSATYFDFEPKYNHLVFSNNQYYAIWSGVNQKEPDNFESAVSQSKEKNEPIFLNFRPCHISMVDNPIRGVNFRNMRVYILDDQYSIIVFNLKVSL